LTWLNFGFSSSTIAKSEKEVKETLVGETFYFDFKNEGAAVCKKVLFEKPLA
jgi:hypothetical protein